VLSCACPGDEAPAPCRVAAQRRSRGPWFGASAGMADRSSERQRSRESPRTGLGVEARAPSAQSRGSEPGCGEVLLRYPARHGGKVYPSVGRPSERPSRAFSCPARIDQRPTGASLDALLLLPSPRAAEPLRGRRRFPAQSAFVQAPAPHPGPLPALWQRSATSVMRGERAARSAHLIASGLTGEPTAPVMGSAGATNRYS
jgi:hypothetical protein